MSGSITSWGSRERRSSSRCQDGSGGGAAMPHRMPLVEHPRELISRIAADRSSGAAQIAADAARAVESQSIEEAAQAIELLLSSHPSMAPLWRLASEVLSATDPRKGAARFLTQLAADSTAPAILAPRLPDTVATISYSSSV